MAEHTRDGVVRYGQKFAGLSGSDTHSTPCMQPQLLPQLYVCLTASILVAGLHAIR